MAASLDTSLSPPAKANKESAILAEACRLFAERGFDGTSIRDIANAVGISNAALYHYFADKNELFARIVIDVIERMVGFTESRIREGDTAETKLRAFMEAYAEFFEDNASESIASSRSFSELKPSPQRDQALYWRDRYESILRGILREGVASGEFRPGEVALTGRAILSCLNWMHRWYSPAGTMTPTEIVAAYADILLGGIRTEGGAAAEPPS
jgi:TetR/AcrR family transcriptional regulator, cholesterol catabolism regulator